MKNNIQRGFLTGLLCVMSFEGIAEGKAGTVLTPEQRRAGAVAMAKLDAKYLGKAQDELLRINPEKHKAIVFIAAGDLNARVMRLFEYESKQQNKPIDYQGYYRVMSIAVSKLAVLAQGMRLREAATCHGVEAMNLESAANGGELVVADCRQDVYRATEVDATQLMGSDQWSSIEPAVRNWLKHNVNYSTELACLKGFCLY